jgi:iron complex outermembrane recepter protein
VRRADCMRWLILAVGAAGAGAVASAQSPAAAASGAAEQDAGWQSVVVSATRVPQSSSDLPVSVDRIDRRQIEQGQRQVNLSESLVEVPGVVAQNRQNYAQDLQLSVRGFGARSSFGVRGVRLYADGVPGTMPDGQGQFSHFDLGSATRIEILRGPFSALYGNSSGGVVALFTADGRPGVEIGGAAGAGTFGSRRYALTGSGDTGVLNYVVAASHFETDGYRVHSAAERNIFNAKLRLQLAGGSTLTLVGNALETPDIQDPLGLTRDQLAGDPSQAGTNAILYNTRKSLSQQQLGLSYVRAVGVATELAATAYGGERRTRQFQAIPRATEVPPTHPGGVIDLGRDYGGVDAHVTHTGALGGGPLRLTVGASGDLLHEARRGFLNFSGSQLGVEGALRRDESNRVDGLDEYVELQWDPAPRWRAIGGVRNALVEIRSVNRLAGAAGPASSDVRYSATNPVAGLTFRLTPRVNLYGSYGKGFETPTLNDLAYRSTDGSLPGLNLALRPARSDNYEAGIKAVGDDWRAALAGYYIKTRNELAVRANAAGRSVFQNIGATERHGAELALDARSRSGLSGRIAYTYLRAVVADAYATCAGLPCIPASVPAGRRLPAVPANALYAGLTWNHAPSGLSLTFETLNRAQIFVDDRNTDAAGGYWTSNVSLTLDQPRAGWRLTETARVDNLFDRGYVGSVIVNESNGRVFEPAPGRTAWFSVRVAYR